VSELIWTTRDGRKIRVHDMGDDHLMNTMRMLIRVASVTRAKKMIFYTTCTPPTAERSLDAFDCEASLVFDSTIDDFLPKVYETMEEERLRRELGDLEEYLHQYAARSDTAVLKEIGGGLCD